MPTTETTVPFRDLQTWVRVVEPDDPRPGALPVIVLHGGPGMAHDYVANLAELSAAGRTVVLYDQVGCGRSSHAPERPSSFWTPELFVEEFHAVVAALGLARYHAVGQSWGGMLGLEIAIRRPAGLASLGVLNSPASMDGWVHGTGTLRSRLPEDVRAALDRHEADGTVDDPEYLAAVDAFYRRHVCRMDPYPPGLVATLEQVEADPTVYHAMNGVNEFFVTGSLQGWSVVDRLAAIAVPTLVLAGEFDEATPGTWAPLAEGIADVRVRLIPDASHCAHLEQPDVVLPIVAAFLAEHDD